MAAPSSRRRPLVMGASWAKNGSCWKQLRARIAGTATAVPVARGDIGERHPPWHTGSHSSCPALLLAQAGTSHLPHRCNTSGIPSLFMSTPVMVMVAAAGAAYETAGAGAAICIAGAAYETAAAGC